MGSRIDYRVTGLVFVVIVLSLFVLVSAAAPSLSGVVVQFNGTPIEGVNVSVYNSSDWSFVSSNLTDSNGTYFVDISEGDTYYVVFNKTGFVFGNDAYRNVTVTIGGTEDMSLNVSLYPDNHGSYNFTVYDFVTGLGIEGVNVTVFASTGEVENRTTDADGVALVQVIANNSDFNVTHNITVSRQGYRAKVLLNVTVNEGFNLNQVIFLEYPQNLSGIVAMFNGSVIGGLNVSVYNSSNGEYVRSNLTDLSGSYFISLPVFGTFDVIFNKSGEYVYENNGYRNVTVAVNFSEEKVLNTSLYPDNHGSYNFTVYDLVTGLLLEDVNVTVFASTGEVENGTTDGDGNAFFQMVANNSDFNVTHDISISKFGYRSQVLADYVVNEGFNENHVVYLDGFRNISGKVTRFNGVSIENMNVSVYNLSTGQFVASNMTDYFGNYFVDLHEWGDFFVIFNKSGNYIYGTSNYRNVSVTVGSSEAKFLNTRLYRREYGSYNLTVRDIWNGRPIPNANVTIYPSAYPYNPVGTGFTDENGNVLVVVIANTSTTGILHNISIIPVGYKSGMLYSESILEGTNKNINVSMTGECEIYGNIEDSQNNLVAPMIGGAYVELWDRQNIDKVGWGGSYYYGAYSGASGQYLLNYPSTLSGTSNCSAYLHVNASGYVSKNDILVESSIVKDINLTGAAYVSGRVVDASNVSQLISGAFVRVINNGSTIYQLYTDSSGAFNVSVRDGINHTIEISILDYGVYANSMVYNSSVDYGTILLYGLGVLNGTLMDETNNSILLGGVDVRIVSGGAVYTATTDSSGRFGIIVKDNTQYDISFGLNGYFDNSTVWYVSNEIDIGSVTLRGKNRVHGVVTDSDNLQDIYVDGTKVELISRMDAKRYTIYTDGDGAYSFYVSSMINDYLMRFDKAGYNLSVSNYSMVNDALINENLVGATHVEGTVTDIYSPAVLVLSSVLIEVLDGSDNVYYSTLSDGSGRYSFDIGVDFNYTLRATKEGYQEDRVTNLPCDHDRSGTGGADRVQDIAMNGTVCVYVRTIDGFDGMNIDNALVCVLYDLSGSDCFYIETTGDGGDVSFNIRGGDNYRLKITRYGYPQVFHPSESSSLSGDFSGDVVLDAYAEIYVYDNYALNNKQVYLAAVELYTYNNQTEYGYDLNETIVNVSASCNGAQMNGLNVTLVGITHSYYSSQNTTGGSPVVSFRTVPVGDHKLIIDGTALGCGYFEDTINIAAGGATYMMAYTTDNVAPVISNVVESADPLEFGNAVTVSADVVDAISSVDYVVIEVGGTNYTMVNVTNVTYQYSWSPASVGVVSYVIYASDIWSNIGMVNGNITVQDTTAPTVILNSPDGDIVYDRTVTFSYTPTELSGFSGCELWTNMTGAWALNATNSSPVVNGGVNTIVVSGIEDGAYRWNVNCTDADGNSAFSLSDKYFAVDAEAPVLTIESPLNASYSTSWIWLNITSNKPLVEAGFSLNGLPNVTMLNTSLTQFYLYGLFIDGSYNVSYYGLAYNGKTGIAGPRFFTVDTGNPGSTSVEPGNESIFFEIATVNFSITADEPVNLSVSYWNMSDVWTATDSGFNETVGVQSVPLFNDTYFWNYTICDDAGNCFSDGDFVFYVLVPPDTSAPVPSDEQENSTDPVPGEGILLSVFWTDDEGLDTAILETNESGVWENKSVYDSSQALIGVEDWSNFTWMNSSVTEGTVVGWRVWANDTGGNWGVSSIRTFTIGDNVPPQSSSAGENRTVAGQSDHILLYAYWVDSLGLDTAVLETNESGVWDNKSVYDSPQALSGVEDWSNFTWMNSSVAEGTTIGWRIWANDTSGNWNVTDIITFVIAEASLIVHVRDENGLAVLQDGDGVGVNVTVYNLTGTFAGNTDASGNVGFTEVLFGASYNISVNGSLRGYGINDTFDFVVSGNNETTVIVNMTKLTVGVVDANLNSLSSQNVTVYESDGVTVFKNAGGVNLEGQTGGSGTIIFDRVVACIGCNATVQDGLGSVLNSSLVDVIAGNSSNYVQLMMVPTGVSLMVYVNDTSGSPVGADSNGDGVNVTLYNESVYGSKNTSTFGYVVFTNLADGGIYNISINGTLQGYGVNETNYFEVVGDNETTVLLNVTRLIVNVTDASFVPIANANVSVYLSDNVTAARNATGGDLTGETNVGGIIIFNRAIPCDDCNVTVSKDDGGVVVNSTRANIITGNSSNYAWVDPPSDTVFDLNFTLNSDIVPVGVTVSVREYNTGTIIGSNTTDAFGNAVIYNVPSGVYDFIIDGEAVGYSKDIYYRNSVGVIVQNTGATDIVGRAKIRINGLFTYYVAVSANGYRGYDDLNVSVSRVGTYDDSINTTGIKPMMQFGLDGNTTLSGHVYDANFKVPMNLSYEPVSGAVLNMYTLTSCEVIPSPALLRYQAVTADNGTYSMIVSPVQQRKPSTLQDYCVNATAAGFISDNVNDVNVGNEVNVGLAGEGVVSGYVKTQDNTLFLSGATVLLRSSQCYDGESGPVAQCSAYEKKTDANGYFSFNVNSRTGIPSYMPYSVLIYGINGYYPLDGNEISSLPSLNNYFYLMPASMSTINVSVISEWGELISDEVSLRLEDNNLVITESDCMLQDNVYVCNINNGDYDLTVNGTSAGYGYYYETDVFLYEPVEKNIVLNVTKVNISLFDEGGVAVSGVNVTIDSVPAVTNVTVNGSALFYKVLPGTHTLMFSGLADYLGVSNSTIDVVNLGGMNSKVLYANETQFYVNVSNGTAGVGNISVAIGGLFNVTNSTGEILFEMVNNSLAGTYFVEFNRTDVYLRGYIAPYPNISVDVLEGIDRETGNNLTVVLNRTSGYGVLRVNTALSGVNVSLWYNNTDYVGHQVSGGDGFAFLHVNVSVYNSSLYVRAEKSGYNNVTVGPYNATDGNITYVDVTMSLVVCPEGSITFYCWCGSSFYDAGGGYCCSGSYQDGACDGGYNPGGGGTSTTGSRSSSGIPVIVVDDPVEVVEDVYDFSVYAGDYYVLSIAKDGSGCVDVPVSISNTGNMVLSNMEMEVSGVPYGFSADFDSFLGVLYPGDEMSVVVRVCSSDGSVDEGNSGCTLSVFSGSIKRDAFVTLRVVLERDDVLLLLRERLERLGSTLFDVDVSSLTPELKEYYDAAMRNLKDAEDYLEKEDYEQAGYLLDEAERNVELLLDGIDDEPIVVVDDAINWYVLLAVALGLAVLSVILYWFFLRKKGIFSKEPVLPWNLPAGAPVFKLPKVDLSSIKVPMVLLKILGKHDVYYAHSVARKRYLTDVVEKVLELKCPKCGGRIYQNRCVWCGYRLNAVLRMGDDAEPTGVNEGKASRDFSKGDVYYTHMSQKSNGVGDRFVTDGFEHVVESVCPKCGGKVYDGKCEWCG